MKIYGVIDRIEDDKIVVINILKNKGVMYLNKDIFRFRIYEGLWLKIEFLPDEEKTKETKLKIIKLQQELLNKSKNKKRDDSLP
ncbi:MAG: hypothetical protein ACK4WJ_03650 [Endomicrobiia bacterium]